MPTNPRTTGIRIIARALLLTATSAWLSDAQGQSAGLVGVVGQWSTTADSALTVDGATWSGKTADSTLRRIGGSIFGAASDGLIRNGSAPGAFPLAVAPGVRNFTGGTLRVQFKMIAGASDQNAGIAFNITPDGEYWYARYNTKDGDLALWRYRNGERELIVHGTGAAKLALGEWHELVVTLRGTSVSASIAGNAALALKHTLDTSPSGRVGVWVKRDAVTAFRRFVATP